MLERALADAEMLIGPSDPDTLTIQSNLATAYLEAEDLDRAIPLSEHTLTDRSRVLGVLHPDTLTSCNNLANAYQQAGRLVRIGKQAVQEHADRLRT
jgi:Tetratricopeptide repeat